MIAILAPIWLIVKPFLAAVWAFLRPILTFAITLPVWAFLIAGAWLYFDRTSAVRTAVNKAVTELVAGAELSALNAQLVEERRISAWSEQQADDAAKQADQERAARVDVENQLKLTAIEKKETVDDIAALKALPTPINCAVDQHFYDGLRNK